MTIPGSRLGRGAAADPAGDQGMATGVARRPLPLQAEVLACARGWAVRVPVRTEHITVSTESVLREEVRVWRDRRQEAISIPETVRSERLAMEQFGARHP